MYGLLLSIIVTPTLATHKGEEEALLQEIVSWVALKYLNAV